MTVLGRYGGCPGPDGACRGFWLQGRAGTLLVGCGSGVAARLHWAPATGVPDAVVLPDLRPDHASDLWALGSQAAADAAAGRRRGLLHVYAYGAPAEAWRRLHRPGVLDVRRFDGGDIVEAAGWRLLFARTGHPWPSLAVRAEAGGSAVGFTGLGDAGADGRRLLRGVDLLLADVGGAVWGDEDETLQGGMTPAEAGALAADVGAGRLLLTHIDPGLDLRAAEGAAMAGHPRAQMAVEGRTYEFSP